MDNGKVVAWMVQRGDENCMMSSFVFDQETADAEKAQGANVSALVPAAAVMELVGALEIARIHVAASAGASHMLEGFGPTRKTRDDLHLQMVDAALAPYREKTDAAE